MKKNVLFYYLLLTLFFVTFSLHSFAQTYWESQTGTDIYNTNSGNVGIGEQNPLLPLHIKNPGLQIGNHGTAPNYYLLISASDDASALRLYSGNYNTGSHLITFQSNGNIGIGTTAPGNKLEVNGKIRAKEIRVETSGWPDFVFNKDYKLMPLGELDRYIKEKGHLPDIPNVEEVSTNGIELGDISGKLLKKIEELTLYIIEKDKEISKLIKANEEIKNELKKIQNEYE